MRIVSFDDELCLQIDRPVLQKDSADAAMPKWVVLNDTVEAFVDSKISTPSLSESRVHGPPERESMSNCLESPPCLFRLKIQQKLPRKRPCTEPLGPELVPEWRPLKLALRIAFAHVTHDLCSMSQLRPDHTRNQT